MASNTNSSSSLKSCLKNSISIHQIKSTMKQHGYCNYAKMCETLQGTIWSSTHPDTKDSVVIKVTSKHLHRNSVVHYNGKTYYVQENILKERALLKYLTIQKNCPKSIVKYIDFFHDNEYYYLVMQNGGHSLFDFVVKVHDCLKNNKISILEWHKMVKLIFKQMITATEYMHNMNVANFDTSLENMLINDVDVCIDENKNMEFVLNDKHNPIQIKLCDLGLSEIFKRDNNGLLNDICSKYVGKHNYKSPEIVAKKDSFSATKNDTWCLGVVLFMMIVGCSPMKKADVNDKNFDKIINGKIMDVISKWGRNTYINDQIIDLLNKIFQTEENRISISDLKQHPWLQMKNL